MVEEQRPQLGGGSSKDYITKNYSMTEVDVTDKWGDVIETHTGYATPTGGFYRVEDEGGGTYSVYMGDTDRGFVAEVSGLTEKEAWDELASHFR